MVLVRLGGLTGLQGLDFGFKPKEEVRCMIQAVST